MPESPIPAPPRKRWLLIFAPPIDGVRCHEFATLSECVDFVAQVPTPQPCRIEDRTTGRYGKMFPSGAIRWRRT